MCIPWVLVYIPLYTCNYTVQKVPAHAAAGESIVYNIRKYNRVNIYGITRILLYIYRVCSAVTQAQNHQAKPVPLTVTLGAI